MHKPVEDMSKDAAQPPAKVWISDAVEMWITAAAGPRQGSLAFAALVGATGRPDPVTVTAHYLSPGQAGSVRITTQILKEGGTGHPGRRRDRGGHGNRLNTARARPCAAALLRRLGVPAWTGEAEDPVLRHARGPCRLFHVGRGPGAVV